MPKAQHQPLEGPRPAALAEAEDLADLSALCFGGHIRPRTGRRRGGARELRGSWIMSSGGKPISHMKVVYNHLLIHGCRVKVASVGGVCTHPDFRGRGAATLLLDHCIGDGTSAGATLLIISGGRGLYRRAQAVDAGPTLRAEIVPGSVQRTSGACSARLATPEDWPTFARLYQQEPVRFVRPADFVAAALSRRHHMGAWIVESPEGAEAYLLLARDWGVSRDDPRRIVGEYAGSRAALVQALPTILEGSGLSLISFDFPAHDRELAYLFERNGVGLKRRTIKDHTIRLLNLPTLMGRLRPYVEARLTRSEARQLSFEQGETCVFAFGDEELEFDLGRSAALVLGGPKAPRVEGELGRVLGSVFPIPLPMPGLNYV
jgi:GNAT superfamily N-acetyltransferase